VLEGLEGLEVVPLKSVEYFRGFEDAVELCLHKVSSAKTLDKAKAEIERIWSLLKERKLDQLQKEVEGLEV